MASKKEGRTEEFCHLRDALEFIKYTLFECEKVTCTIKMDRVRQVLVVGVLNE